MLFTYGLTDGNALVARRLYQERYPNEDVQIGKHLQVSIAAFVNTGILHLVLPTGDDQDLRPLK
jgi:hypothetical protein